MAKKGDILVRLYNEFPDYLHTYKSRLNELEREFLHAKNNYDQYLNEIDDNYKKKENKLTADYLQIELHHNEKIKDINREFSERFSLLEKDIAEHNQETQDNFDYEDNLFQDILSQFEDRKAQAFNTYLNLTKETDYLIDREMKVHHDFVKLENDKIESKRLEYQDLNTNLSNQLLWTMEKAKNSLAKLSSTLVDEGTQNKEYLSDVINESLRHLTVSRNSMTALFKTTTNKFEKERNIVQDISKEKRKPHSEINQKMILTFINQIRDVNYNKVNFERMIKEETELTLSRLYPKIIEADVTDNSELLRKLILQKEIIEKKMDYLLNRNQTMSDLLISKYQNEIKKIKIDSFKRSEEIKLAYSVPVAFLQNSINIYSNFAFYLNETYEDLAQMLINFKQFNQDYIGHKTKYIHDSQKAFEDYKINLLVKVNSLTSQLTEYISEIDQVSHEIVTLESRNRLEIAEIRKKMENLEIFGDYQKYLASLENDQFFAVFQHNTNTQKIQINANYKTNLLNINKDVLMLNENKLEYEEFKNYLTRITEHEKAINIVTRERKTAEITALYKQKIDQVLALSKIAHERIIFNAKKQNFDHASCYVRYQNEQKTEHDRGSKHIIEYIHQSQKLIDINTKQTESLRNYIDKTDDDYAYIRVLEKSKSDLIEQIENESIKKNSICVKAISIYEEEINHNLNETEHILNKYLLLLKQKLLNSYKADVNIMYLMDNHGYRDEIISAIEFVNKKISCLTYKYQIPLAIKKNNQSSKNYLEEFVIKNLISFKKIIHKKTKSGHLKTYLVETITLLEKFQKHANEMLNFILSEATNNDRLFIAKTNGRAEKTKQIINKEFDRLEFIAYRYKKSKTKQINHLKKNSEKINDFYKKQVQLINEEFMNKVNESELIGHQMAYKFYKVINRNNRELNKMLKFLDKLFLKEKQDLELQFEKFQNSLTIIKDYDEAATSQEISYIANLYDTKKSDANKTIQLLEKKINDLPVEKNRFSLEIKKEKYELQTTKSKELNRLMSEIEKNKFVSRPKYLAEIDIVKNRLPEDYVNLYNRIQGLEFSYLNQFTQINEEYTNNYKEYLLNQAGNNEILEVKSKLYLPFESIQNFTEAKIKSTNQTYKETAAKSKKTRDDLKKDAQLSADRQKRIINV